MKGLVGWKTHLCEQSYHSKNIEARQNYLKKLGNRRISLQQEASFIFPGKDLIQMTKTKLNTIP